MENMQMEFPPLQDPPSGLDSKTISGISGFLETMDEEESGILKR
jgi:hypothetical protein